MTTQEINRNFKIKIFGRINGKKINSLFGVSGTIKLLESTKTFDECQKDLFYSIVDKAFKSTKDSYSYKLRRGLKITLYRF